MDSRHNRARGEGKIGCILSLLVFIIGIGVGLKVIPIYYNNNSLESYAGELAGQAGIKNAATILAQLRDRAKELEIPEALRPGGITVSTSGTSSEGTCTVQLHYSRPVDLYGVYRFEMTEEKRILKPYMDVR